MDTTNCPCGRDNTFENCCKMIHDLISLAKTPEDLMRSRYSAFFYANIEYLIQSWDSETRDNSLKAKNELLKWTKSVTWLKLKVLNSTILNSNEGTVEFKAYYFENGLQYCIHENSFFKKKNNHWVYTCEFKI